MKVADGEQLRLALGQPFTRGCRLALRAVSITATIIRNDCVGAALVLASQATCPPSAAVRQRSIALITFSCSRLMWPRLASRQAGPWSRKISATSRPDRAMQAGYAALGLRCFFFSRRQQTGIDPVSRPSPSDSHREL